MNRPIRPAARPVLMAWELGENFGHVLPLLSIARRLRERGRTVVFALRDLRRAGPVRAAGFPVLQAPAHPDRRFGPQDMQPANFAEVLAVFGFANAPVLDQYVAAWRALFGLVRPALVVASHAPTALFAARLAGLPAAVCALPFELPPPVSPPPDLRPWEKNPPERHRRAEAAVLRALHRVARGRVRFDALHMLYDTGRVYLNSFAELDAYAPRDGMHYGGVLPGASGGVRAQWPSGNRRIFAYLQTGTPRCAELLDQLRQAPWAVLAAVPGARSRESGNLRVAGSMLALEQVLPECDAVLSYGGHGLVAESLLAGKPLALVPGNLEQLLTARQVARLGAGVLAPDANVCDLIERALDSTVAAAAQRFAVRYSGHDAHARAVEIADQLLEGIGND